MTLKEKRRGLPRRMRCSAVSLAQRSSWSTLCWDWLASASADTAIDWRVASAWLLAASSLVSASVRLDDPVCSTLIRFFEKSWRICTIDRFEPRADASVRSVVLAAPSRLSALFAEALSRKSVPLVNEAFNWSRDWLAPKVMLVAVPPPVAAIVSVSPDAMFVPSTKLAAVPTVVADVVDDLVE